MGLGPKKPKFSLDQELFAQGKKLTSEGRKFFRQSKGKFPMFPLYMIALGKVDVSKKGKTWQGLQRKIRSDFVTNIHSPSPMPIPGREERLAKRRVRRRTRRRGRESTILAGRMMAGRNDILKTRLG